MPIFDPAIFDPAIFDTEVDAPPEPTGPITYPWTLFRGVVISPVLEWSKGLLHLTLECRDNNRVWRRTKIGVPLPGNFLEQPDGTHIEHDPAAGVITAGPPELLDGLIPRGHVEHYWPGDVPNTDDILTTNPDYAARTIFQKYTAKTDLGSFLDEFIGYQDPYTRYHLDADHHVWYRKLAPIGDLSSQEAPAPWKIVGDPADLDANSILANISASWDMDRIRRRLFVRGATSVSSGWFTNPFAPVDAGEEYIEAPGAITAEDAQRVADWHFANKFRAFLTGTAEIPLPSNSDGDFYGFDGWRVGDTLRVTDRELSKYTTHPMSSETYGFLPTIITAVRGQMDFAAEPGALGVTLNSILLDDLIVAAKFTFSEQGFAQVGSATLELWLTGADILSAVGGDGFADLAWGAEAATIEIPDLATVVVTTNGKAPLKYTLTFGDIEPGSLQAQFAREREVGMEPGYHFETFYADPDMPPGGETACWFQYVEADGKPITGSPGIPALLSMLAWGDEDETVPSDEYTLVDEGAIVETNVLGQVYSTVQRASSPSVPAVKWDADAQWTPA